MSCNVDRLIVQKIQLNNVLGPSRGDGQVELWGNFMLHCLERGAIISNVIIGL